MKRVLCAVLVACMLSVLLCACDKEEKKQTTVTGMVVSLDGTVLTLREMDMAQGGGSGNFPFGNGQMPGNMEGFEDFEGFEGFEGGFPGFGEGGQIPSMPEGETMPNMEDFDPENMPDRGSFLEGMERPNMEDFAGEGETKTVDISDAHISVQRDGVKESGNISDVTVGSFVTVTLDNKEKASNVLVTPMSRLERGTA